VTQPVAALDGDKLAEFAASEVVAERLFEEAGQITDISNYTELTKSNESQPEHNIVYVTETVKPELPPSYQKLTTCALALRAGRDFTSVDQVRAWLAEGISVRRFHPSELNSTGPSNLFPDLVYYLLTDTTAGLGRFFSDELIDTASFTNACRFLRTNKLFFNGAVAEPQNVRSYIADTAPFFLLDFVIGNGRFSLQPSIPTTSTGAISGAAVPIAALFTEGNIIEDTFTLEYLEAEQRKDFIASMRYRFEQENRLPEERTVTVRYNEGASLDYPFESYDLTDFCCSREHAVLVAKYLLSVRRRITHTVSFKTTPTGLSLAPGNYIRVLTQSSPYQSANNGIVEADGTVVLSTAVEDNTYPIFFYDRTSEAISEGNMSVVDGKAVDERYWDTLITVQNAGISNNVYQVQELTYEEDGLVQIVASEHPTGSNSASLIAGDLLSNGAFVVES